MLSIRFKPIGKKGQHSFRVVVDNKRSKLKGAFVEDLGWYNPHNNGFSVSEDRTKYWLGVGAQPTNSVHNLLVRAGVIPGPKKAVHSTKKKKTEEVSIEKPATVSAEATADKEEVSVEPIEEVKPAEETQEKQPKEQKDATEEEGDKPKKENKEEGKDNEVKESGDEKKTEGS